MVRALIETNILVDFLHGAIPACEEFNRYDNKAISVITWMEAMVGTPTQTEHDTRNFLNGFTLVEINEAVAERAVLLRRHHRLKLPDAIVWASAQVNAMLLVTRDTKNFPADDPGVRVPYQV